MAPRDWRNPADYADLAALDLASLAWEFLRRNPQYRAEYAAMVGGGPDRSARWGLRFPLSPDLQAADAPLFWRAEVAPAHVVVLTRSLLGGVTRAALVRLASAEARGEDGLHLRLRDGLQLLVPAGVGALTPLAAETALDPALATRLTALGALERALMARGTSPDPLSAQGRNRAMQMVRAVDGRGQGASYRDIAEHVLGRVTEAAAWRTSATRDVAIRLCRSAWRLVGGGYRGMLLRRR